MLTVAILSGVLYITYQALLYPATEQAFEVLDGDIEYTYKNEKNIYFIPESPRAGFIFYPGGFVDHSAYIPLMSELADQGILCVIAKMPFCLAVFDTNAADDIMSEYPEVDDWYIGGHSLGGAMSAAFASNNSQHLEGLILLGAYSIADISDSELDVLSIYGSEDGVLNKEKYDTCRSNLPSDFTEQIIEGGNHAYFGVYGEQKGDKSASVTNQGQISTTASLIVNFIIE